mgnify:CR=1 FL=1
MNCNKAIKLIEIYTRCPKCRNDIIGENQGELNITGNIFERKCSCGWNVRIVENEEVKDDYVWSKKGY